MSFEQWLESRDIDCQELAPELLAALQMQFEREQRRLAPVAEVLVLPVDCAWPQRGHWTPAAGQ